MKGVFVAVVFCLVIAESFALECYHCKVITEDCKADDATLIKCGTNAVCSREVKKGASDTSKAIRKCVIPDSTGHVNCPNGYDCTTCKGDGCNSASIPRFTWIGLVGLLGLAVYM